MKKSHNSILRFSSRLFSVLLVLMLVGVVFVPAVAAENVKLTAEEYPMELISSSGTTKEYMVYSDTEKTKPVYFVRSEQIVVDGKEVNSLKMYAMNADGSPDYSRSIIKDSYYWYDDEQGLHIHIGPIDMSTIITEASMGFGFLGTIIGSALGEEGGAVVGAGLAFAVGTVLLTGTSLFTNADNSLDIYIDRLTITLLPLYIGLIGTQFVTIRLGTTNVLIPL